MTPNVLEKLRSLPPEKQQEVEDFVVFLAQKYALPQHSTEEMGQQANTPEMGYGAGIRDESIDVPEDY